MRELFLLDQKNVIRYADISTTQLQETLETSEGLFWLDFEQMTEEDASFLLEFKEFKFHPLAVKACQGPVGRSYLTTFSEHLFLLFTIQEDFDAEPAKLCLFLTPDYLVTFHNRPLPFLQRLKDRVEGDHQLMRSPGYSMAVLLHALVDHLETALPQAETDLATLTDMISEEGNSDSLRQLGNFRRRLSGMRRIVRANREVVNELLQTNEQMQPETLLQVRGVYHRFGNIVDAIEQANEGLETVSAIAVTRTSQQLNASVGRLTTVAAVFLPVIAVAALLGVNERLAVGVEPLVLVGVAGVVSIVVGAVVALLARQR